MNKNNLILKISVTLGYLLMIIVNYLANALPIGGVATGEASEAYANLFTPAGITFSIWGLIYLLLLGYLFYQFGLGQQDKSQKHEKLLATINKYFLITSVANISWIFAWHYGVIWLSVIIMLILLFSLIKIADLINKEHYSTVKTIFIRLPFSIYFGWITIATIANIIVFLVSINWNGWGLAEVWWTVVILAIGAGIGLLRTVKDRNIFYLLVFIWAYSGILIKHLAENGFNGAYPAIIISLIVWIVIFLIFLLSSSKMLKR